MIDAITSVLPPPLREKRPEPPPVPQAQFQIIEQVSELGAASQRALSLLSRMGQSKAAPEASPERATRTEDDYPEVEVSRGSAVSVST